MGGGGGGCSRHRSLRDSSRSVPRHAEWLRKKFISRAARRLTEEGQQEGAAPHGAAPHGRGGRGGAMNFSCADEQMRNYRRRHAHVEPHRGARGATAASGRSPHTHDDERDTRGQLCHSWADTHCAAVRPTAMRRYCRSSCERAPSELGSQGPYIALPPCCERARYPAPLVDRRKPRRARGAPISGAPKALISPRFVALINLNRGTRRMVWPVCHLIAWVRAHTAAQCGALGSARYRDIDAMSLTKAAANASVVAALRIIFQRFELIARCSIMQPAA